MRLILFIIVLTLSLLSCGKKDKNVEVQVDEDTPSPPPDYKISWLDSSRVIYNINHSLTHRGSGFDCDSAIAVDYIGFHGEDLFYALNNKGQWINTIKKRKKLSKEQLQLVHSVLGSDKTFDTPMIVSCYEPRLGIIYFKKNKVIAQSAICLSCAGLQSTAKLGSNNYHDIFNRGAYKSLEKLCEELAFSECHPWRDL